MPAAEVEVCCLVCNCWQCGILLSYLGDFSFWRSVQSNLVFWQCFMGYSCSIPELCPHYNLPNHVDIYWSALGKVMLSKTLAEKHSLMEYWFKASVRFPLVYNVGYNFRRLRSLKTIQSINYLTFYQTHFCWWTDVWVVDK